jgi:hypothetical protein
MALLSELDALFTQKPVTAASETALPQRGTLDEDRELIVTLYEFGFNTVTSLISAE